MSQALDRRCQLARPIGRWARCVARMEATGPDRMFHPPRVVVGQAPDPRLRVCRAAPTVMRVPPAVQAVSNGVGRAKMETEDVWSSWSRQGGPRVATGEDGHGAQEQETTSKGTADTPRRGRASL